MTVEVPDEFQGLLIGVAPAAMIPAPIDVIQ
jgi:hypothetical protein